MSHDTTQPSLLRRVRDANDHAAWHEFDAKYRGLILGYCHHRGLQASDAEDVRQVVMMNLARSLPNFEYQPGKGKFRYYLGRSVRNAISQHLARPNRARAALDTEMLAALPAEDVDADQHWEQEWVRHHFRLAMQTVRTTFEPRSIEVFDRLLAGDSIEQAAQAHGLTEQAVHKIKQRIRDRLKELIAEQVRDEDEPDG